MTDGEAAALVAEALVEGGPAAGRRAGAALNRRARGCPRRWAELYRRGEARADLLRPLDEPEDEEG